MARDEAADVAAAPKRREITRLEAFSDAVFAFSATLLVVSLEVPRTYPELLDNLNGFAAFGLSFAMLILIWAAHNSFFRRFGLEDAVTITLNGMLLFVVLFYVYPLKFMSTLLATMLFGLQPPGGSTDWLVGSLAEGASLLIVYGLGFIAVFLCLSLLYLRAYAQHHALTLTTLERFEARIGGEHYLLYAAVGLVSVLLAWLGVHPAIAGYFYVALGPISYWHGVHAERRRKALNAAD